VVDTDADVEGFLCRLGPVLEEALIDAVLPALRLPIRLDPQKWLRFNQRAAAAGGNSSTGRMNYVGEDGRCRHRVFGIRRVADKWRGFHPATFSADSGRPRPTATGSGLRQNTPVLLQGPNWSTMGR
jgi:hypothetical protein